MKSLQRLALLAGMAIAKASASAQSAGLDDSLTTSFVVGHTASAPPTAPLGPWSGLRREYLSSSTPIRVLLGASVDQWLAAPKEWPRTIEGFGRRGGVRLAEVTIQVTVLYGTAALLGQDPTYRPLRVGSAWQRTQHAVLGAVTAYGADGSRQFAAGTFTSAVAAAVVAKQLLPGTATRGDIVARGTSMLTNRVVRSLWIEFLSPPPSPKD